MNQILPDQIDETAADLITSYLRGELSTTDKALVESMRKSVPAFKALFISLVKLSAATRLSHLQSKKEMLQRHAQSQPQTALVTPSRRLFSRIAAAAALILLVGVALFNLLPDKHDRLFEAHFSKETFPGKGELSGEAPSEESLAFDLYAREEYGKAAKAFDKLLLANRNSDYLLYAAISHLGAGHIKQAQSLLDQAYLRFPENKEEIVFFQALAYVRDEDLNAAKKLLDAHPDLLDRNNQLKNLYQDLQQSK